MAIPLAAIGAGAALVAGAILRLESESALQSGPEYVKDGQPEGLIPEIGLAIARQACRRYADGEPNLLDDVEVGFETVCRPYLDNIGYGQGPSIGKPFEGLQCPTEYRFRGSGSSQIVTCADGSFVTSVSSNPAGTLLRAFGPLQSVAIVGIQPTNCGFGNYALRVVDRDGNTLTSGGIGSPAAGLANRMEQGGLGYTVTRVDGGADNCGDPPPVIVDPVPPPQPGPDKEPFNPGPDIDIDINVNLRPDSLIEVNLGFGPILVPVFGDGGGGPGGDPDQSPPAPEPGPENPGGNGGFGGDDEFGPPPAGRRWVGCCIRITNTPQNAGVIVGSEPEDVYPSVIGNIRLVCNAAGNRLTDTPVRILAKNVCVWEPVQKLNPTGVNVDLLPGYGYTFRPFSVPSGD